MPRRLANAGATHKKKKKKKELIVHSSVPLHHTSLPPTPLLPTPRISSGTLCHNLLDIHPPHQEEYPSRTTEHSLLQRLARKEHHNDKKPHATHLQTFQSHSLQDVHSTCLRDEACEWLYKVIVAAGIHDPEDIAVGIYGHKTFQRSRCWLGSKGSRDISTEEPLVAELTLRLAPDGHYKRDIL